MSNNQLPLPAGAYDVALTANIYTIIAGEHAGETLAIPFRPVLPHVDGKGGPVALVLAHDDMDFLRLALADCIADLQQYRSNKPVDAVSEGTADMIAQNLRIYKLIEVALGYEPGYTLKLHGIEEN